MLCTVENKGCPGPIVAVIATEAAMGGVQILGRSHEVKSASFAQPAADMAEDLLLLARACDHPRPRGASTAPLSVVISG